MGHRKHTVYRYIRWSRESGTVDRSGHFITWQEGNVLFNNALNTFYLWVYGVRHGKRLLSERGNPLPPHGLLFFISSKGSFICIIPQTG